MKVMDTARGENWQIARCRPESLRGLSRDLRHGVVANERAKKPPTGFKKNEVSPELRLTLLVNYWIGGQAPELQITTAPIYRSIKDEGISQRQGRAAVLPPEIYERSDHVRPGRFLVLSDGGENDFRACISRSSLSDCWKAWDKFVEAAPASGFMQSSWWVEFRNYCGFENFGITLTTEKKLPAAP